MINMKTQGVSKKLLPMLFLLLVVELDLWRNDYVCRNVVLGIGPSNDPIQKLAFVTAAAVAVGAGVVAGHVIANNFNFGNFHFYF